MEKVTERDGMEIYENDIAMALSMFCESNQIENIKTESQSVWNGALRYIRKVVFPTKDILKSKTIYNINNNSIPSNCNCYNYNLINNICDIYIDLCFIYDKEISLMGFSNMTGINIDTFIDWGKDNNKLSRSGCEIYQKLLSYREESLSDKLATGNKNPVGILAILNRHYQWNLPGVSREKANNTALTVTELHQLGANNGSFQQLEDNNNIVDSNTND